MKTRNGLMAVEIHLVTETSISSVFIVAIGVILHVFLKSHLWTRHGTLSWPSRATERQRARARVLLHPSIRTYIISCYDVCDVCVCVLSRQVLWQFHTNEMSWTKKKPHEPGCFALNPRTAMMPMTSFSYVLCWVRARAHDRTYAINICQIYLFVLYIFEIANTEPVFYSIICWTFFLRFSNFCDFRTISTLRSAHAGIIMNDPTEVRPEWAVYDVYTFPGR